MTLTITKGQHKRQDSEVQSALASCALISPSATTNSGNVQQRAGQKLGLSRESSGLTGHSAPPSPGRSDEHSSPVAEAIFWFQGARVRVKHTPTRISWKPVGPDTSCCMEGVRRSYKIPYDEVLSAWQLPKTKMCSCLCAKDNSLIIYTFSRKPRSPCQWVSSEHILYSSSPELVKEWVGFINAGVAMNVDRPKQLLVFVNPFSGAKRAHAVWEKEALPVFQKARIKYQLVETTQMDHAKELIGLMKAEELAQYSGIVAVGGDGLFQELIRGLLAQRARGPTHAAAAARIRVGHIPAGSTDAVAYSLHGTRSAETSALHIALGDRTALDVARVDGEDNSSRHFVCQAGYGFLGDVMRASESLRWMGPSRYDLSGFMKFLQLRTYSATVSYRVAPDPLGDPSDLCTYRCEACRLAGLHMERTSRTEGGDCTLSTSSTHSAYSSGGAVTVLHSSQLSSRCPEAPQLHGSPSRVRRRSSSDHHNLHQQQLSVPLFQQQSQPLYGSSGYTGSGGGYGDSSAAVTGANYYASQRSTSGSLGGSSPKGLLMSRAQLPPLPSQHPQLQTMVAGSGSTAGMGPQQHVTITIPPTEEQLDSGMGSGGGAGNGGSSSILSSAAAGIGGTTAGALSALSSTLAATVGVVSGSIGVVSGTTSNANCNHLQAAHRAVAQRDASQLQATLISPSAGLGSSSASMPLPVTSSGPPSPAGFTRRTPAGGNAGVKSGANASPAAATANGVSDGHGWTVLEGEFVSIMSVVCPCRSDKSKKGIIPHGHLADGRMYLVMVSACNHVQYLQFLLRLSAKGVHDAVFPWVKVVPVTALTVQANGQESVWNVDGELMSSSLVRMRVQRGLVDVFARGVETVMPCDV